MSEFPKDIYTEPETDPDTLANLGIICAGAITFYLWRTIWPDVIVGLAIAAMNIDAARAVWTAARDEHRSAALRA